MTDDILESRPFDEVTEDTASWEGSTLRKYLNGPFFRNLPPKVRKRVVRIWNNNTSDEHTPPSRHFGNPDFIEDRVFLLSEYEVELYLKDSRKCCAAAHDEDESPDRYEDERFIDSSSYQNPEAVEYAEELYAEERLRKGLPEDDADSAWDWETEHNRDESYWSSNGWWLRTTSQESSYPRLSDYGMCGCKSRGFGSWYQPYESLGVRVALCIDVSSCPNPDLDTAVVKPGWRAKKGYVSQDADLDLPF